MPVTSQTDRPIRRTNPGNAGQLFDRPHVKFGSSRPKLLEPALSLNPGLRAGLLTRSTSPVPSSVRHAGSRLRDRVQAVVYAYDHGLVRPGSRSCPLLLLTYVISSR